MCGWFIFSLLRFPVADLLGSMAAVALLRYFYESLPMAPDYFSPLIQVCLGLYIGSKVTREKIRYLRSLIKPALIIVSWAMLVAFVAGGLMAIVTNYNISLITGLITSTVGGLPEMTIIAMETEADVVVVVVIKTIRIILTVTFLPIIFEKWLNDSSFSHAEPVGRKPRLITAFQNVGSSVYSKYQSIKNNIFSSAEQDRYKRLGFIDGFKNGLLSLGIAALGGIIFRYLNVPAGAMVGGMFFVIAALFMGVKVKTIPINAMLFLRVALGIVIADNINKEVFAIFSSTDFLMAAVLNTVIVFSSFIVVMLILHKVTSWDYQTCFLAASPAGFSVMVILAAKYDKDVFSISMLHLCRLLVAKTVFPFLIMYM